MRVVLDVNVWVSGLLWRGVPARIFDLAAANKITIYTSEPILADIEEILGRKKFQSKINALNMVIHRSPKQEKDKKTRVNRRLYERPILVETAIYRVSCLR
ncbi:putative toxin-antitoxin system toxin component, PIN family [Desmonostoc muscorum CCALA 125]|nr:putative toxin-antitoxin system toxin component, PIN family [Desmonostoc muscorum CCALA 125]